VLGGCRSLCVEPFPFDLFVACTIAYHDVLSYLLCAGIPVGRLLLLRYRESVPSYNFVWRDLVFLWCTGGEGCPPFWAYSLVGRSFLIRDRESVLWLKLGFGLFMVSFGGSEVERWWKLNDLSDMSFAEVAQLWCSGLGVLL